MLAASASSQSLKEYLALRTKNRIVQAVSPTAIDQTVGERIFEVQGVVKGSFGSDGVTSLMLERPDGQTTLVESKNPSAWLLSGEVAARMIVKCVRSTENSSAKVTLLGAAPEAEIQAVDVKYWTEERKKRQTQVAKTSASRKGKVRSSMGKYAPLGTTAPKEWYLPVSEQTPLYASWIRQQNPRLSSNQALEIAQGVIGFSLHYGIDARLVLSVLFVESGFKPNATSNKGAMGLGQLMPSTAAQLGVKDAYNNIENLAGSVKLIRKNIDQYWKQTGRSTDTVVLALAAYNAGNGAVKKHGGVPPYRQTQDYVRKVIAVYNRLCGAQ